MERGCRWTGRVQTRRSRCALGTPDFAKGSRGHGCDRIAGSRKRNSGDRQLRRAVSGHGLAPDRDGLEAANPYLDITGEADVVAKVFSDFDGPARAAGVSIMSGVGSTADWEIPTTAVAGDWKGADAVSIGFALDGWKPTPGTRNVLQRMGGRRTVFRGGKSVQLNGQPQFAEREFSGSVGKIPVMVDYPGPRRYVDREPLRSPGRDQLHGGRGPEGLAGSGHHRTGGHRRDGSVRSELSYRGRNQERRCVKEGVDAGTDIYATTAPIVVDALERAIAKGKPRWGNFTGRGFRCRRFLKTPPDIEYGGPGFDLRTG